MLTPLGAVVLLVALAFTLLVFGLLGLIVLRSGCERCTDRRVNGGASS
ncbi:hypothetical protein KSP35_01290 [Aquihabitans sp. G128]|nr:hypothetical protein [Aquihabitans sp. G128]QXC61513.1 hypothetical protein KSP35_01290 [Aquihabitans sp. G128]